MKNTVAVRRDNGWRGGFIEWVERETVHLSVVFSWQLVAAARRIAELESQGWRVLVGGPAICYAGLADGDHPGAYRHHNDRAVFTTRGCPFRCPFCIVPSIEGDLVELPDSAWKPAPRAIVCDNTLNACSRRHFDRVIDRLKGVDDIDIQGVSLSLLTSYQASRLAELRLKVIHVAWDNIGQERQFFDGFAVLREAGIPKSKIVCYVLIGYKDSPDDALYRLEMVRALGVKPFPMRYQPLDVAKRNEHVGENWTHDELVRYCRYWANLRITNKIPFAEFDNSYRGGSR